MQEVLKNNYINNFLKQVIFNILSMIGISLYVLADTFFVANGIGNEGLAALNISIPIFSFLNGIGLLIGMGGAIQYSIYKENIKKTNRIFNNSLIFSLLASIVFTLLGVFFSEDLSMILGANEVIRDMSSTYIKIILSFSSFFIFNNVFICFIRNDNKPKLAMFAMLSGSILNIFLDYYFIFILDLGIRGAAIATVFSPLFSILIIFKYILKNFKILKLYNLDFSIFKKTVHLGITYFLNEFSSGIIIILFNLIIMNLMGNIGVAAYGIIANVALVVMAIFTGLSQGIQPVISENYGMDLKNNVKTLLIIALVIALILGIIIYGFVFIYSKEIVNLFNKESNFMMFEIANTGLKIYFVGFLFMGINFVIASFFSSVNMSKPSFIISFSRGFLFIIPFLLILSYFYGIKGVWATVPAAESITFIISYIFIIKHKKSNIKKY